MLAFLVITTVVMLPFFFLRAALDPVLTPTFALLAIVLSVLASVLLLRLRENRAAEEYGVWRRLIFPICGVYVALVAVSLLQAINMSEAFFELLRTALAVVLLVLAVVFFGKDTSFKSSLTKGMVISGFVQALIGVCQYYDIAFTSLPGNSIPYGTMANKGLYSSFLCLTLPFSVYGGLRLRRFWRYFSLLAAVLILLVTVVAQTRSAWVALAAATMVTLPVFLIWLFKQRSMRKESRQKYLMALGGAAIVVVIILALAGPGRLIRSGQSDLKSRMMSILRAEDSSSRERLILWKKCMLMFQDHPLAGVGAGNCKIVFPAYGVAGTIEESGEILFQRPHNDYIWVLTETGIFGLAAYLMIFGTVLVYAYRVVQHARSEDDVVYVLLMLFGVVSYMTDSFFSFPKERITHLAFLMLVMAGIIAIYHRTFHSRKQISLTMIRSVLIASLLISACSVVVGVVRVQSEIHTKIALAARQAGDWPLVISEVDRARSTLATLDPTATPLAWYRGIANFSQNNTDQALLDFEQAYRDNPNHMHVLNNLGTCYEMRGNHEAAITYYTKVLQINPRFNETLLNLTAVYYNLGRYQDASETISQIDSNWADPRLPVFRERVQGKVQKDSL